MTYPFGETVQVLDGSVGAVNYDGDTRTWPVKATYSNVPVAPADANGTGGNEYTDGRDTVIIGLTAYLPDGATIAATDRLSVRGDLWEVVGQPQPWQSPYTGWRPGIPVALRRVTG
jgi:hypothetical protein